jgi:ATP-dependent Clp protease protease subunit
MDTGKIYISGVIGEDVNDIDVIRQVKSLGNIEQLNVYITSPGGSIDVGFAIYNYLKTLPVNVSTYARGNCDSIATVIFQAGKQRYIEENINSFVIHNAHITLFDTVDANQLSRLEKTLRTEEDRITSFYSQKTGLDFKTLDRLMDKETNLNSVEVVELGFADSSYSELKAAAKLYETINKPTMNIESKINDLWNHLIGKKPEPKNIFFLKLADGTEAYVDSPDGDFINKRITRVNNGNITDEPLTDGLHELAVGGSVLVEGGIVKEVVSAENMDEPETEETETETEQTDTETMTEEAIKALLAEFKTELLAELGAEKEEMFTENKKKAEQLDAEYAELKNQMRSVVTEFSLGSNEKREETKEDDLLGVATMDNIRKVRAQIKDRKN